MKSATLMVEAAGFNPTPQRMDELSRVLNGFVDRLLSACLN